MMRQSNHADCMTFDYKRRSFHQVAALVAFSLLIAAQAAPDNGRILFRHGSSGTHHASHFHETFRRGLAEQQIRSGTRNLLQHGNASALQFISLGKHVGVDMVEIPEGVSYEWVLEELKKHPEIEFAEEDKVVSAYSTPNDPNLPQQWALYEMGLFTDTPLDNGLVEQGAWNRTYGGDVIVCIIDSGVDWTHPDLAENIWVNKEEIPDNGLDDDDNGYIDDYRGINVMTISGDVMDDNFHGTHLSGMVGALCNNHVGICGISPVVKLMGCKFLDSKGNGYTSDAVKCLDYALQMGVDITLNSYGGLNADSDALKTAITAANRAGQLFVTAAGNDYGTDIDATPTYPAAYQMPNILSVISTNESMQLAPFSNYGAKLVDLAAPGTHILSTTLKGGYGEHDGTSQSAGYVAGAAALLLAAYRQAGFKNATGAQMKELLMKGARRIPDLEDKCKAGGVLDVAASMGLVPVAAPSADNGSWILNAITPPGPGTRIPSPPPARTTPVSSGLFGSIWGSPDQTIQSLQPPKPLLPNLLLPPGLRDLDSGLSQRSVGPSAGGQKIQKESVGSTGTHNAGPSGALSPSSGNTTGGGMHLVSLAQDFRNGFPLAYASLTFVPHPGGVFTSCLRSQITRLPSYHLAGLDITADVRTAPWGYIIKLSESILVGSEKVSAIAVTRFGDLRLLHPSAANGEGLEAGAGTWTTFFDVPRIAVVGSDKEMRSMGKVLYNRRPDRLVITYSGILFGEESVPSTFQAEIFLGGRALRAGSVRLTWLDVGASNGVVGISGGQPQKASTANFTAGAPCPLPAVLKVNETAPIRVVFDVAAPYALRVITVGNPGSLVLSIIVDAFPQGESVLERRQCPAAGASLLRTNQTMWVPSALSIATADSCSEPGQGSIATGQTVRFAKGIQLPLRTRGSFVRGASCGLQWIALSREETLPLYVGDGNAVWLALSQRRKHILTPVQNISSAEVCADTGSNMLNITMDRSVVVFRDDQCGRLVAKHDLGPGPLYIHMRQPALPGCSGDMTWDSLEVSEKLSIPPIQLPAPPPSTAPLLPIPTANAASASPAPGQPTSPSKPTPANLSLPHSTVESASIAGAAKLSAKSLLPSQQGPAPEATDGGVGKTGSNTGMRILVRRRPQPTRIIAERSATPAPAPGPVASLIAAADSALDEEDTPWDAVGLRTNATVAGDPRRPDKATGLEWLMVSQTSLMVAPGGLAQIGMLFNSTGLAKGRYTGTLVIRSNDPDRPVSRIPLLFTVR